MIVDVRERFLAAPFVPFVIRALDGRIYSVPTAHQAFITRRGNRVIVVADNGAGATAVLGPLHINCIIDQQPDCE
jgi:hypothetical protein